MSIINLTVPEGYTWSVEPILDGTQYRLTAVNPSETDSKATITENSNPAVWQILLDHLVTELNEV